MAIDENSFTEFLYESRGNKKFLLYTTYRTQVR